MGLELFNMKCINCKRYALDLEDVIGGEAKECNYRGIFYIPVKCDFCNCNLAVVFDHYFNDHTTRAYLSWALAYEHTLNDEPCYDSDCEKCAGKGLGWWE